MKGGAGLTLCSSSPSRPASVCGTRARTPLPATALSFSELVPLHFGTSWSCALTRPVMLLWAMPCDISVSLRRALGLVDPGAEETSRSL